MCVSEWSRGRQSCVSTNPRRALVSGSQLFLLLLTFRYSLFISCIRPWFIRPLVTFDFGLFAVQLYLTLGDGPFVTFAIKLFAVQLLNLWLLSTFNAFALQLFAVQFLPMVS
jgi:hypothetical protein